MLLSVYFPGGAGSKVLKNDFTRDLRRLMALKGNVIICGDLNSRHRDWLCKRANTWGKLLVQTLAMLPYSCLHPQAPTYVPVSSKASSSIIDLILSNVTHFISQPTCLYDLSSDHVPVLFNILNPVNIHTPMLYDYSRTNWHSFKTLIKKSYKCNSASNSLSSPVERDEGIQLFLNRIEDGKKAVPLKNMNNSVPRFPKEISILIKAKNRVRRDWSRYRCQADLIKLTELQSRIKKEIMLFRNQNWNDKINSLDKGARPFWNLTKVLKKKNSLHLSLMQNGQQILNPNAVACALADQFSSNFTSSIHLGPAGHNDMVNDTVTSFCQTEYLTPDSALTDSDSVSALIKNLKVRKAVGFDLINNRILKNLPPVALNYLTNIYNACLTLQYFPTSWKIAKVIAIHKVGKPANSVESYRPISLLSSLSKLLEKIIKKLIDEICETNNIIPAEQFGFRSQLSTTHQIYRVKRHIKENFSSGKSTVMILLDAAKAFDSIWHNGIAYKLIKYGFPPYLIKIIYSFLLHRSFQVCVQGGKSNTITIPAGVPQGSVLGPCLFNIYVSDFPNIKPCHYAAYADDVAIYHSSVFGTNSLYMVQDACRCLATYYDKWKIKLNLDKTQAIFFTRKRNRCFFPPSKFFVLDSEISWSRNVKYLGVILDSKLCFKEHTTMIIEKVQTYIKLLYPLINRRSRLSNENKIILIKVIFQAIICYACPAWGSCANMHIRKLQICQNKLLKMALNLPFFYSTNKLHSECCTDLIIDKINKLSSRFHDRMIFSDNYLINSL